MKRKFTIIGCILFWIISWRVTAQNITEDKDLLQSLLIEIASQSEEEQDMEQLLDWLEELAGNPIQINHTTHHELSKIFWLTEFQIKSLLEYTSKQGPIVSVYEIAYLYGFTPELAQTLIPFISLESKPDVAPLTPQRILKYGKTKILTGSQMVLEQQKGYMVADTVSTHYTGIPFKLYSKYSYTYSNRLYWGITAENDAGEEFFKGSNPKGFDFYSMHFQVNQAGSLKTLVIGDYRSDFGQGLVMWSGLNYGKSTMVMNAMRYNSGLRKYTSSDENRFLRGVGATFAFQPVEVSLFYSRKAIDATTASNDLSGKSQIVSSLQKSGYHRTLTEMGYKDVLNEQLGGINLTIDRNNWHLGGTALYTVYDAELIPKSTLYNLFYFKGRSNLCYSLDYRFRIGDVIFYGEQAFSQNNAMGMLHGIQMLIIQQFGVNILYRNYARNFHSLYGQALGESSANINEEGFYLGWNWTSGGNWKIVSYLDIFRFPWLRYRVDAPSSGQDALLRAEYTPAEKTMIYGQIRFKEKEENAAEQVTGNTVATSTTSGKLAWSHQFNETYGIGNHLEVKYYQKENNSSKGYFFAQDASASWHHIPLKLTIRYAVFDTEDYNSRIYSYENDMLHSFSIPAFFDQGTRIYLLLRYSIYKNMDLRFKIASTRYFNKESIGSGSSEIHGNRMSEVKLQLSCKF